MWNLHHDNLALFALQWGVVFSAALAAMVTDLRSRRIPNLLTGPVLLAGMTFAAVIGGFAGWLESVAAGALLATPFIFLFLVAGGGAGDAKLMLALGAWLGVSDSVVLLIALAASSLVCGLAYAAAQGALRPVVARLAVMAVAPVLVLTSPGRLLKLRDLLPRQDQMVVMPYGVAIFTGVCLTAAWVWIWQV